MRKVTWLTVVTRPMTILTQDFFLTGIDRELKKLLGVGYDAGVSCKNGMGSVLEGEESGLRLEEAVLKKANKDPRFFRNHLKDGGLAMKNLLTVSKKLKKTPFSTLSNKQLLQSLKTYKKVFHQFSPFLFSVFPIEQVLTNQLKEMVGGKEDHFRILTTVQRDSEFYLEQKDLLEILIDKKKGRDIEPALESHANLFGYMGLTNDFKSELWDIDHFRGFFKDFKNSQKDLKKLLSGREKELKTYKSFIQNRPKSLIEKAETLQEYMWFRNERISILKMAQNNIKPLLTEIAKRFRISFDDLIWYKVAEIENLLVKGKRADVSLRKKYFRIELVDGKLHYIGKEVVKKSQQKKVTWIKGTIASLGKVEGIARVLFSPKEIDRVKDGDILVTSMTTPDYVMAMRRSAAIVTDEGGVLCHAAIVSREFGIPCIIGTQIATQVLKDGDRILVDAEKGIVSVL